MDRDEAIQIIKKFVKRLKKHGIKVEKVILFGSYAKGNFKEYSDIDVAIISPDFGRDRFEERILLSKIAAHIDRRLEPHPVGTEELEKDDWKLLIHEIKTQGIEIAA